MGLIYLLVNNEQYTYNCNIQMLENITDTIITKISIHTYLFEAVYLKSFVLKRQMETQKHREKHTQRETERKKGKINRNTEQEKGRLLIKTKI